VARLAQLVQEVGRPLVLLDLHPAQPELRGRVGIAAGGGDLPQLLAELCRQLVVRRPGPGVVGLDDVDSRRQLDDPLWCEAGPEAVAGVRQVGQAALSVDPVQGLLRVQPGLDLLGQEESDDLAFAGLDLLAGDGQPGMQAAQLERPGGGVVVGERDPVEADFAAPRDQVGEAGLAVGRVVAVEVEVDAERQRKRRMILAGLRALTDCSMSASCAR